MYCLKKAANLHHKIAQYDLAAAIRNEEKESAYSWSILSAKQGYPPAIELRDQLEGEITNPVNKNRSEQETKDFIKKNPTIYNK